MSVAVSFTFVGCNLRESLDSLFGTIGGIGGPVAGSDSGSSDTSSDISSDIGGGNSSATDSGNGSASDSGIDVTFEALGIHFLELGNQYTGDCTFIDLGDTEILIDAGSRKNSAATIDKYIEQYCEDGVLEYVIATHADQDHIAGFVGNSGTPLRTGILYQYEVETLIQFPRTNKNTEILKEYRQAVEYLQGRGTAVYTALECWNNENGAQRTYDLGEGVTMQFLYQRYYEEKSSDENNYSVCMMLTRDGQNFLFTGDLEKSGEESLVKENNLPKCVLYKGGHHGSPTSSTDALLSVIQPQIVCVCCCAGSAEYTSNPENQFPSQAFIDRVAPYTDRVYVTTRISEDGKKGISMNGNICVTAGLKQVDVHCSNNDIVLKDTEWFQANRTTPSAWRPT